MIIISVTTIWRSWTLLLYVFFFKHSLRYGGLRGDYYSWTVLRNDVKKLCIFRSPQILGPQLLSSADSFTFAIFPTIIRLDSHNVAEVIYFPFLLCVKDLSDFLFYRALAHYSVSKSKEFSICICTLTTQRQ